MREAERSLRAIVEGVGNVERQRLFRMNVTLCLHKAATNEEVATQSDRFLTANGTGLAGGPVQVLSETEPGSQSTRPCHNPRKFVIDGDNAHGWIPLDCGDCEPCLSRDAVASPKAT